MKLKKYILSLSVAFCTLTLGTSCTDWLDEQPNDKQSEEQQFATKPGFYAAVNGVYDRMSGNSLYGQNLSYEMIDVLGQRYEVNKTDEGSYYNYWDYSNETVMSVLSSIWGEAYQTIMNINVVLKNLEEKGDILPVKEYKMLKGEMLAARAMIHFDLLRLFGPIYAKNPEGRGIPYNQSTKTSILPILSAQEVLNDEILIDLLDAQELLLESDPVLTEGPRAEYDGDTMDNSQRYRQLRLNYYATTLLVARAYLWAGDYANAATDIEFEFPFGFKELEGIHSRTDFDLSSHSKFSGKKLQYFDPETNESYVPYVIETSIGLDRMFLAMLSHAYTEEKLEDGSERVVMKFPAALAPYKVAILPLVKKDGLPEKAREIMEQLTPDFMCQYEEKDSIGKRYRRQDAIGTPLCVTIDNQTLEDNTVTVRDRDTMEQIRVNADELYNIIRNKIAPKRV